LKLQSNFLRCSDFRKNSNLLFRLALARPRSQSGSRLYPACRQAGIFSPRCLPEGRPHPPASNVVYFRVHIFLFSCRPTRPKYCRRRPRFCAREPPRGDFARVFLNLLSTSVSAGVYLCLLSPAVAGSVLKSAPASFIISPLSVRSSLVVRTGSPRAYFSRAFFAGLTKSGALFVCLLARLSFCRAPSFLGGYIRRGGDGGHRLFILDLIFI